MTSILLIQIAPAVMAKQKGDWNDVKALAHYSAAVETKTGETYYGLLQSADDSGITLQIADLEGFTPQEINFQRNEVAKVWRARLRFGQHHVGKGALIGAGTGLGVAYIAAARLARTDPGDPPVGVGLFPFYGAAVGAVAGAFWKKKHKKQELVYSI